MGTRLAYLDRLKAGMTILVILHHLAITYGGSGDWYYSEHGSDTLTKALLSMFTAINQSFFMGLFFFISGYVTPASFDRKGAGRFLQDRLLRFGIPLLGFMLIIDPLLGYVSRGYKGTFWSYAVDEVASHPLQGLLGFHTGPLWFLVALLLFNGGYAVIRKIRAAQGWGSTSPLRLTPQLITGYLLIVGVANFAVRLWMPVGETLLSLQLAYFPAYIGLYFGGIAAYRGQWLEQLNRAAARRWGFVFLAAVVLLPVMMAVGGALDGQDGAFKGGLNWQSACYSFIDPIMGFAISYWLMVRFRDRKTAGTKRGEWLSHNAFAVYVIHPFFVCYTAYLLQGVDLYPLLKFALVGCMAVPLCFAGAALLRRLPAARRWM